MLEKLTKLIKNGYTGAGIVYVYQDEVLMQLRRHPAVWAFIGGGFDRSKDSDLLDTAVREFYEETGIILQRSDVEEKVLHALGFWKYRWELYVVFADRKIYPENGPESFRNEYYKYKYVPILKYKNALSEEDHKHTFFFVKYQLKLLKSYLKKYHYNPFYK